MSPDKTDEDVASKNEPIPASGSDEAAEQVKDQAPASEKRPPKFIYNCINCGQYCAKVEGVPVTLEDLRQWHSRQMMATVMPHLELTDDITGNPRLVLAPLGGLGGMEEQADMLSGLMEEAGAKKEGGLMDRLRKKKGKKGKQGDDEAEETEDEVGDTIDLVEDEASDLEAGPGDGAAELETGTDDESGTGITKPQGCPFHDSENHLCQIHHALPTSCRAFPLGSNGSKYFIVDKECQGLGQGQMTVEKLSAIRDAARADFTARTETGQLLTTLYSLFMGRMAAQSAQVMGKMDAEKLKQLGELLGHQPPPEME